MAGISCICGAPLVAEVTDRGIYPVGGGEFIPFRRTTDYVMCDTCLRTYNVRSLLARAETAETIESLERLAENVEADEPQN